jgi:SAM-dependent methyltransferase
MTMNEQAVADFWSAHPCGDAQVGGLNDAFSGDHDAFFDEYDRQRYRVEAHIPECLDHLDVSGKRVLEIGLGEGAESEQLIRRGAKWSGIDLTQESIDRVRARLASRGLPFEELHAASVLSLPFADDSFDMVFSHGVLHHVPDITAAQREIHRVLRPDGLLAIMVYARWSLNYVVSIAVLRRLALLGAYPLVNAGLVNQDGLVGTHVRNAKQVGLARYLRMREFVHRNTDGADNPFSRVYDAHRIRTDFSDFELVECYKRYMHAPPLPVHGWPGGRRVGWHLWAHLRPT